MSTEYNDDRTILALDVASSKTGYAIYVNGKIEDSGTWRLKEWPRYADLYEKIDSAIREYRIEEIVAEDIFYDGDPATKHLFQVLAECRGVLRCAAQQHNLSVTFISPVRIKQHIWDMKYKKKPLSRTEQKKRMVAAVKDMGYSLKGDKAYDEADAIGLLIAYIERGEYCPQRFK
jgi:Holliday junction resolvasome RuvABC endonuclease subunit